MSHTQNIGPLFDWQRPEPVPTSPLARNTDPETSKVSATMLLDNPVRLSELHQRALTMVTEMPGLTANDYERHAQGSDPTQHRTIARRLSELADWNLIHRKGTLLDAESGRPCVRWYPGPGPKEESGDDF